MGADASSDVDAERREPARATRALLHALAAAEDARAAAAAFSARAGPRFLASVGGEPHLARLLTRPAYAPLVGHRRAVLDPPERLGDAARITFTVHRDDGTATPYLLSMVRAPGSGGTAGAAAPRGGTGPRHSWRVTGLVREELHGL